MLNAQDKEHLAKSQQSLAAGVAHLRELAKSENALLADITLDLLREATQLEQRLSRFVLITNEERRRPGPEVLA